MHAGEFRGAAAMRSSSRVAKARHSLKSNEQKRLAARSNAKLAQKASLQTMRTTTSALSDRTRRSPSTPSGRHAGNSGFRETWQDELVRTPPKKMQDLTPDDM